MGRIIVIWIDGGVYPEDNPEFNLLQDIRAAQILMDSTIPIWQVPMGFYPAMYRI